MKLFSGSHLKIERAKKHINDLHSQSIALARHGYRIRVYKDANGRYDIIEVSIEAPIPPEFALIIGDALHNLKSALDLAVNEIVFTKLGEYDDYTRFPFRKTRSELEDTLKGGKISKASKNIRDVIVHGIKPYIGGNDTLWSLHQLNIRDKHRVLLPVWKVTTVVGLRAEDDRGRKVDIGDWVITRNRTAIYHCIGYGNVNVTNNGAVSMLVLFEKGLPVDDEVVVKALQAFTTAVEDTLEELAIVFAREI